MSSVTSQQAAVQVLGCNHKRMKKLPKFDLPPLADEPIYCESAHCSDDVLYSGSDDEHYESSAARSHSYATRAKRFLAGRQPLLLSASLKGPFTRESGWCNPWLGRRAEARRAASSQVNVRVTKTIPHSSNKLQPGDLLRREDCELATTSQSELWSSSGTPAEARDAISEKSWLRRENLKRTKFSDDDVFAASPTANILRRKSRKLDSCSRSFSAPAEVKKGEAARENKHLEKKFSAKDHWPSGRQQRTAKAQNLDSDRSTSMPSDWPSQIADCLDNQQIESPAAANTTDSSFESQQDSSFYFRKKRVGKSRMSSREDANDLSNDTSESHLVGFSAEPQDVEAADSHKNCEAFDSGDAESLLFSTNRPQTFIHNNDIRGGNIEDDDDAEQIASQLDAIASTHGSQQLASSCSEGRTRNGSLNQAMPDCLGIGDAPPVPQGVLGTFFDDTTLIAFDHQDAADGNVLMQNFYTAEQVTVSQSVDSDASNIPQVSQEAALHNRRLGAPAIGADHSTNKLSELSSDGDFDESEFLADHGNGTPPMIGMPSACPTNPISNDQVDTTNMFDTDDSRLATQDQSPWVKTQLPLPSTPCKVSASAKNSPVKQPEATALKKSAAPASFQSPWAKEPLSQLTLFGPTSLIPTVERDDDTGSTSNGPIDTRATSSLSQNPWKEDLSFSSSIPKQLTSPCSPNDLPRFVEVQQEDGQHFFPAAQLPSSLGTAPSTPDTKHSSLPTPDLSISIKSFRNFRSPTPTPLPHKKANGPGGLRSALAAPRRKSSTLSLVKPSRRVRFALTDEEAGSPVTPCPCGTEENEGDDGTSLRIPKRRRIMGNGLEHQKSSSREHSYRPASPPPAEMVLTETLPSEVDKFQGHFTKVVNRTNCRVAITTRTNDVSASGLSHDVANPHVSSSSPGMDAVAVRFQEMDAETARLQEKHAVQGVREKLSEVNKAGEVGEGDKEIFQGEGTDEPAVDDVQDVIDNLDDFLAVWDVDVELAKGRASGA